MFKNKMVLSFALSLLCWVLMTGSVNLAIGILCLIFVHEMGHYFAFKHRGLPVSEPVFTPFGAFVSMPELPANAEVEAYGAIAGPLVGTVGALICLILGHVLGIATMVQVAGWGFMLNCFNLIPLAPLDGGRISMAIERRMYWLGIPMIAFLFLTQGASMFNMIIIMLIVMGAVQDIRMRSYLAQTNPAYFDVGFKVRVIYAVAYLALGAFLVYSITNLAGLEHLLARIGL